MSESEIDHSTKSASSDCGCLSVAGCLVYRCEQHRPARLERAFLDGVANAAPAAAKKAGFLANARRRRRGKSDRPAQESPKKTNP